MNYKYNELTYAEKIYNNGFLTKHIPTELRLLVLYFRDVLELKPKEREFKLYEFCKKHIPNFSKEKFYKKMNKALNAGLKKEQKLIEISEIDIYKSELDYINSFDINQDYKKVMFTFLVQLRLNKMIYEYRYDGKEYNSSYFKGETKKYNNIKKISNIPTKMLLNDEVINCLEKLELVTILHKGTIKLDYIENCKQYGVIAFTITDFNNIGLYFDYYNDIKGIIKCEACGKIIKMRNNKTKYCLDCSIVIEKENHRIRQQNYIKRKNDEIENIEKLL